MCKELILNLIEKPICEYTWLSADKSLNMNGSHTYSSATKSNFENIDLEQKEALPIYVQDV